MMDDRFIVKPNRNESTTISIRIEKKVLERLDDVALKTNRSRNQLIGMALKYALDNLKLED
jgi:predicted transcriptional regulator